MIRGDVADVNFNLYLADGSGPFTGTPVVGFALDNAATYTTGTGTLGAVDADGAFSYRSVAGETNAAHVAFKATGTGCVPMVVNVYPRNDVNASGVVAQVTLVDTTTTNTDRTPNAPTVVQNRQEMDSNSVELAKVQTVLDDTSVGGAGPWTQGNTTAPATPTDVTDSEAAIIARGDIAWITGAAGGDATEAKQDTIINNQAVTQASILTTGIAKNSVGSIKFRGFNDSGVPTTGLSFTGTRMIDGSAESAVGGTIAEIGTSTWYRFTYAAADNNGDDIAWNFIAAGGKDVGVSFQTVS